ncbi:MAG: MFS transporter [Erwinia billingiae]|uniref:MFS transporter n=1 Tax=Erwinia billingiae TaxID=182337 RepID=UPI00069E44E7|nr:MFS transporter [Erwinia billingiae]
MNHSALNIANAMGAWLGGLAVSSGFGWISTAYVGVVLGITGLVVYAFTVWHARRPQACNEF